MGKQSFELGKNELRYRLLHKKNAITKKSLKKNTIITESMIENSEKKIVAVLACRVDSSRLFAKPLQLIGKFRILELLINQIRKSKSITEIVLAISNKPGNEIFVDFAQKNKLKFILGNDVDVLKRLIDAAQYSKSDIIFRVTPENPFIYWEGIDDLIKKHISGKYDLSIIEGLPLGSNYEIINRNALEISHKNGNYEHRSELCTLYINQNQKKFKILKTKPPKKIMRPDIRLTVDTPEDLIISRLIYKKLGNTKKIMSSQKIIDFIDKNPEILKINSLKYLLISRILADCINCSLSSIFEGFNL